MSEKTMDTSFLPKKAEGCLRLVTNNILQQTINNSLMRLIGLIDAFKIYDADIVAFQEVDVPWRSDYHIVEEMAKIGYGIAAETGKLHTPIYYRADKFTLMTSAVFPIGRRERFAGLCLKKRKAARKLSSQTLT